MDLTPPSIVILSPANGTRTREPELALVGFVEPGARLLVDGATVALDAFGGFNHTVSLSGGTKVIDLLAQDAAGNTLETSLYITRVVEDGGPGGGPLQSGAMALIAGLLVLTLALAGAALIVRRRRRVGR